MDFLETLTQNYNVRTQTENGAVAWNTTLNPLLDLFSRISGYRDQIVSNGELSEETFEVVKKAWEADKLKTLQIILNCRDILNGQGERDTSKIIFCYIYNQLAENSESTKSMLNSTIKAFSELGRWDDIVYIYTETKSPYALNLIQSQLDKDIESDTPSLLGKWLPSENTSSTKTVERARILRKALNLKSKEYRCILSSLRKKIKIIENNLREKDYTFDYSKVPSKAMLKYAGAFTRNDNERFEKYKDNLSKGTEKVNTKTLTPANIIHKIITEFYLDNKNTKLYQAQWDQMLKDFKMLDNIDAIVAADVSGSMFSSGGEAPIDTSIGLALFFAYKNKGKFANHYIDFCGKSRMHKIDPILPIDKNYEKVRNSSLDMSTNVDSVFHVLLETAKQLQCPQSELPKYVILISDMEFNMCSSNYNDSNYEGWKKSFEQAGYTLPTIIFWNVACRNNHSPAQKTDNIVFLSGTSQNGFKTLEIIERLKLTKNSELAILVMFEILKEYDKYFEEQ